MNEELREIRNSDKMKKNRNVFLEVVKNTKF